MSKGSVLSRFFTTLICITFLVSILSVILLEYEKKGSADSLRTFTIDEQLESPQIRGTRSPAETTRSVLAELFTGTWNTFCQGAVGAMNTLANEYPLTELTILEYHVGDDYEVPGNDERRLWYDINGYPTCEFDGIEEVVGGSSAPDDSAVYNNYKENITTRSPIPSPVTITLTGSLSGPTGSITTNITAIDEISPSLTDLMVRFVIYEDHNYTVWNSSRQYRLRYTVVENLAVESISLSQFDNLKFTKPFSVNASWDTNVLGAVVFVQSESTKEILQAVSLNLSASSSKVDLALTPHDISFSDPNPLDTQVITINAKIHNKGTTTTPSDVYVRFFDGDPSAGGTQIGVEQNAGIILPNSYSTVQVLWDTTGMEGDHEIVVVADYPDTINESENENNNKAPRFISVLPPPPPEIDYVQIRDAPGGLGNNLSATANYPGYAMGHVTTFYAAGYNYTSGYVSDLDSLWISGDDTTVVVTTGGSSSTITCSDTNYGTAIITVVDDVWGKINTTEVTVLGPTVDYIQIRTLSGGGGSIVSDVTYNVWELDYFYPAAYNDTVGYLYDIVCTWESSDPLVGSINDVIPPPSFIAQRVTEDSTCTVTATYGTFSNSTGLLTVLAPKVDEIMIRNAPNGGGDRVSTATYSIYETDDFYAAAYNNTVDYLLDVVVEWECDWNPMAGELSPLIGNHTTFTAQPVGIDVVCMVFAMYQGHPYSTGWLTVLAPNIDEIVITDTPNGSIIDSIYLSVGSEITFYASAYNNTVGYLGLVDVTWSQFPEEIGHFSNEEGTSTIFTAGITSGTTQITGTNLTLEVADDLTLIIGDLIVDFIQIRDATGNQGVAVISDTFILEGVVTKTYYCAGYNNTAGYVGEVVAEWSVNGPIGTANPEAGTNTMFTATNEGIGELYAVFSGDADFITITVDSTDSTTVPAAPTGLTVSAGTLNDTLILLWNANTEADLIGYNIYRSNTSDSGFTRINTLVVIDTTYIDTRLNIGIYYYRVTALDSATIPNESDPSLTVMGIVSDSDSLPDDWEVEFFDDLNQDPAGDFDFDGFTNLEEFQAGSDPTDPLQTPEDTDGDGLPDSWEWEHFNGLVQGPNNDFDNDGYSNEEEYLADTDPDDDGNHPGIVKPEDLVSAYWWLFIIIFAVLFVMIVIILHANRRKPVSEEKEDDKKIETSEEETETEGFEHIEEPDLDKADEM
jgi:hypothetical protein